MLTYVYVGFWNVTNSIFLNGNAFHGLGCVVLIDTDVAAFIVLDIQ